MRELRDHARALGFLPREAVRWLSPGELARTGVKVALATIFAGYADKREMQDVFDSTLLRVPDAAAGQDVWLDFVADLGDGFDATFTVASYLAQPELIVEVSQTAQTADAQTGRLADRIEPLERGALLVMGGDEVYPTASARDYEDRTTGLYEAALPAAAPAAAAAAADAPQLVALPGNHDWYDGLTSFLRIFCQGGTVGGWRLTQTRSYFAVQLPRRWWLLAVDSQLGTYIDKPQLDYFEEVVTRHLQPGDGVILCSATPTWVHTVTDSPDAFDVLHWFERTYLRQRRVPDAHGDAGSETVEPTGASVRLWITGDSHHYARYAEELRTPPGGSAPVDKHRRQMVTCGLGGAYLSATHDLPEELVIPPAGSRLRELDPPERFVEGPATYPAKGDSAAMARRIAMPWRAEFLAWRNPGFAQLAGGVHAALFLLMIALFGVATDGRPVAAVRTAGLSEWGGFAVKCTVGVLLLLLLPWMWRLVRYRRQAETPTTVVAAVVFQLVCALLIVAVCVAIAWPDGWPDWLVLALCLGIAAGLGALLGSEAFALFILTARSGRVFGWQLAGESIEDHKGFVRMRISADGDLVLYPLIIDTICRDWRLAGDTGGNGTARPVPAQDLPPPRLAEEPITIARQGPPPAAMPPPGGVRGGV